MLKSVIVWSVQELVWHQFKARKLWCSKHLTLAGKVLFFRTIVLSILLYGCETWPALERHTQRLEVFQMICLRYIWTRCQRSSKGFMEDSCAQGLIWSRGWVEVVQVAQNRQAWRHPVAIVRTWLRPDPN